MRTNAPSWTVAALAVLAFVTVSAFDTRAAAQVDSPRLQALKGVDELKSWFNANRTRPRLVLLLSPT